MLAAGSLPFDGSFGPPIEPTTALTKAPEALRAEAAERADAEAVLRQLQKMEAIGQLTGGIAHDFNNVLTAISGSLELLQARLEQGRGEEGIRHLEAARRAVKRGTAMTRRLLAFAQREALEPRPLVADGLVRDVVSLIRQSVGPHIDVAARLGAAAATILCDGKQLEATLFSLASNARDAMPLGGTLTLATATRHVGDDGPAGPPGMRRGDYVEIAVTDSGHGMSPEVQAQAFEPFFTTKPPGQGTGLGLSQTYRFVHQSGGFILLETEAGVGTTVRLLLPRCDASDLETVASGSARAPGTPTPAGTHILVVEDEAELRELMVEVLAERGSCVLSAADGPAALEIIQSEAAVDLLVTDVGLPGLDGWTLADAARALRPALPVLFVTGYEGDGSASPPTDLPAGMQVIGKPFTLAALLERVTGLLQGHTLRKLANMHQSD